MYTGPSSTQPATHGKTRAPAARAWSRWAARGRRPRPPSSAQRVDGLVKAGTMAGGGGTRLAPVTPARPRPLVPVLNRPVLEHLIRLLARHGVTEAVLTRHYLTAQIE